MSSVNSLVIAATVLTCVGSETQNGNTVTNLRVSVTTGYGDKAVQMELGVTYWGTLNIAPNTPVLIEGSLQIDKPRGGDLNASNTIVAKNVTPTSALLPINRISLTGRTARDPEVRYFESGSVLANLTIAVDRRKKDADPNWVPLVMWAKTAEVAANYVRKGALLGVTGEIQFETWSDRATGASRHKLVVRVDELSLLGGKRDQASDDDTDF
jgi:single-strand DNA-binding protein